MIVAVGIKTNQRSKLWCQAVEGELSAPLLRTIERELGDIEAVDLQKGPAGFGLKFGLGGKTPKTWPSVPDSWKDASESTKSKRLRPPDDLFKILRPD